MMLINQHQTLPVSLLKPPFKGERVYCFEVGFYKKLECFPYWNKIPDTNTGGNNVGSNFSVCKEQKNSVYLTTVMGQMLLKNNITPRVFAEFDTDCTEIFIKIYLIIENIALSVKEVVLFSSSVI